MADPYLYRFLRSAGFSQKVVDGDIDPTFVITAHPSLSVGRFPTSYPQVAFRDKDVTAALRRW